MQKFDAIVVGLGAMGAALTYQLARQGVKVLGIDQYQPPHNLGSTSGGARLTRLSIGEGEHYLPLAKRSHEIWREMEREAGVSLFDQCGFLLLSQPEDNHPMHGNHKFFDDTVKIADKFGIDYEIYVGEDIERRFPMIRAQANAKAYFEKSGGFIHVEAAITTELQLAKKYGAEVKFNETVQSVKEDKTGITVTTTHQTYKAKQVFLCMGYWIKAFLPELSHVFKTCRQEVYWFKVKEPQKFLPTHFPPYWSNQNLYAFPCLDPKTGLVKISAEYFEENPHFDRKLILKRIQNSLPEVIPEIVQEEFCWFTVTPDFHFIVDKVPGKEHITFVSACSAHGFKHAPALAEAIAEKYVTNQSKFNLNVFELKR